MSDAFEGFRKLVDLSPLDSLGRYCIGACPLCEGEAAFVVGIPESLPMNSPPRFACGGCSQSGDLDNLKMLLRDGGVEENSEVEGPNEPEKSPEFKEPAEPRESAEEEFTEPEEESPGTDEESPPRDDIGVLSEEGYLKEEGPIVRKEGLNEKVLELYQAYIPNLTPAEDGYFGGKCPWCGGDKFEVGLQNSETGERTDYLCGACAEEGSIEDLVKVLGGRQAEITEEGDFTLKPLSLEPLDSQGPENEPPHTEEVLAEFGGEEGKDRGEQPETFLSLRLNLATNG